MKYLFCSITLCIAVLSAAAQAPFSSWYAISYESPAYIPTFEKVDLLTGNRVLSVPLPHAGYFSDVHFFSRPGRYVVQLQDSLQDNYLVEIDTNGIVVRNTYIDSGPGTLTKYILPSFNSNFYYGLRLSSTAPGYEFFRLNPQSGLTTVLATMSNTGTVYADNAVINRRDELFFWSNDFMAGGDVLYRAEPSTQSIVALDTLPGPDRFFASIFDCYTSTIYGLIGDPFAGGATGNLRRSTNRMAPLIRSAPLPIRFLNGVRIPIASHPAHRSSCSTVCRPTRRCSSSCRIPSDRSTPTRCRS